LRSDMHEILIERPRGGAGWGRSWPRFDWRLAAAAAMTSDDLICSAPQRGWADGGPTKLRMGPRRRSKWLNENLAPLRRFLLRRVGRPWNAVHAEICAQLKLDSTVQKHVLDHLRHYVELYPVFIDNWPHHAQARRYGLAGGHGYSPLSDYGRGFYVCPQTGTLQHVRRQPRRVRSDVAIAASDGPPHTPRVAQRLRLPQPGAARDNALTLPRPWSQPA